MEGWEIKASRHEEAISYHPAFLAIEESKWAPVEIQGELKTKIGNVEMVGEEEGILAYCHQVFESVETDKWIVTIRDTRKRLTNEMYARQSIVACATMFS